MDPQRGTASEYKQTHGTITHTRGVGEEHNEGWKHEKRKGGKERINETRREESGRAS